MRVIAVGCQTMKCDSRNRVLVDDKLLDEPYVYYLPDAGPARHESFGPVTVPPGSLWTMGDRPQYFGRLPRRGDAAPCRCRM